MWASIRAAGAFHADSRRDFFRFYVQIFVFVMVLSCGYKLGALLWRSWSCSSSCLDLLHKLVESAPRCFSRPNQHVCDERGALYDFEHWGCYMYCWFMTTVS